MKIFIRILIISYFVGFSCLAAYLINYYDCNLFWGLFLSVIALILSLYIVGVFIVPYSKK